MVLLTMIDYPTEKIQTIGEFELIQITYDLLRGWNKGEDKEIAHFNGENWEHKNVEYSDFTIIDVSP